jgi:hypothetical protein
MTESNQVSYEMPRRRRAAIVAAVVIIIGGSIIGFESLPFKTVDSDFILGLIAKLIVIALFMERAQEFFVELWRGAERDKKLHYIEIQEERITDAKAQGASKDELEQARSKLADLRLDLRKYRSITMRVALWSSFLLGLLISAVGIRSLTPLVEVSGMTGARESLFIGVDIILTSCLIAGGSEGLHKIMKLYNRFMDHSEIVLDKKAKKVKEQ